MATTIDIDDDDFTAGRYNSDAGTNPSGTVTNRVTITAAESGPAALVAPGVENSGAIRARLGRVTLASGNSVVYSYLTSVTNWEALVDRAAEKAGHAAV